MTSSSFDGLHCFWKQIKLHGVSPKGLKFLDNLQMSRKKKVRLVKAMVFPVVMYGCESWTVKKAEL